MESLEKAAVLERVLAFYDKFAEQNSTNPKLQFEAAKAHRRVGELHNRLHQFERATIAFRRAAEILEGLKADSENNTAILAEMVITNAHSPDFPKTPTGRAEAERHWLRAIELGRSSAVDDSRFTMPVADAYTRLALARSEANDPVGEEAQYRSARKWFSDRTVDDRGPPRAFLQARVIRDLALFLTRQMQYAEAKQLLEASIAELQPHSRIGTRESPMTRSALVDQYLTLAVVLRQSGDQVAAKQAQDAAVRLGNVPRPDGRGPDNRGGPGGRPPDGPPGNGPRLE